MTDQDTGAAPAAAPEAAAPKPAPATAKPAAPAPEAAPIDESKQPYLTVAWTDEFGPRGRWHDLTDAEAKQPLADKVIIVPTEAQLALRQPVSTEVKA